MRCDTPPIWSGTVEATGDGEYRTAPVTLTTPGYYTYRESIAATDFVRATETACNDVAETTVVMGTPAVAHPGQRAADGARASRSPTRVS